MYVGVNIIFQFYCKGRPPADHICLNLLLIELTTVIILTMIVKKKYEKLLFFFRYIRKQIEQHQPVPLNASGLSIILCFYIHRYILYPNKWPRVDKNLPIEKKIELYLTKYVDLLLVFIIFILNCIKEILKKIYIIILLSLSFKYSLIVVLYYGIKLIFFIGIISSLALDQKVVLFLLPYGGPFALGWLGNYQCLDISLNPENNPVSFQSPLNIQILKEILKIYGNQEK